MTTDRTRQIATVLIFLLTLAVNGAANALPINGQTTCEISDRFQVFVIPAGYVFGIWGVIYLGLAAFTVYQALRGGDPVVRRVGWLPALTGIFNTAWLLLFQFELFVLTVPVMIALLITLIAINQRLWEVRDQLTTVSRWTIRYPFSIYLGWITIATIANIAQTLSSLGVGGFGIGVETAIAGAVLLCGLAIALTFVARFGDFAYGAVIVWAYIGIVVKEAGSPIVPVVAALGAVAVGALMAWIAIDRVRGRPTPLQAT
jgi:benzodiazapine receptor